MSEIARESDAQVAERTAYWPQEQHCEDCRCLLPVGTSGPLCTRCWIIMRNACYQSFVEQE